MRVMDCILLAVCAAAGAVSPRCAAADEQLTIAMDRDHLLFVSTTLKSEELRQLSFGLDLNGIQAFKWIDEQALLALATSTFRLDPGTNVTVWVDPSARPFSGAAENRFAFVRRAGEVVVGWGND